MNHYIHQVLHYQTIAITFHFRTDSAFMNNDQYHQTMPTKDFSSCNHITLSVMWLELPRLGLHAQNVNDIPKEMDPSRRCC